MVLDLIQFLLTSGEWGKNVVIFRVDNSSLVYADNRKKDIPIFVEEPTDGLDGTTIMAEVEYCVNIINHENKICLSLQSTVAKFVCMLMA